MLVETGRPEEAAAALEECSAWPTPTLLLASFDLAYVVRRLGRVEEVRARLERLTSSAAGSSRQSHISLGDFVAAADRYAAMGSLVFEAHARLAAAEALAADGRRAEADEQIGKALAFFRSVGATRYIREGEALLAPTA